MTRTWYYKGKRPRLVKQKQFLSSYIFGAVCPSNGKSAGFLSPYCNSAAMQIHLDIISQEIDNHAILILDGAGWHSSKALKIPTNITLLPLPPYSPELNSKENMWQVMKDRYLANRTFESFEHIMDACEHAWNDFTKNKDNIINLCSRTWAKLM